MQRGERNTLIPSLSSVFFRVLRVLRGLISLVFVNALAGRRIS